MNRDAFIRAALAFDALADALREMGDDKPDAYTSTSLPPDVCTRATFARQCRAIGEAQRIGRTWSVPRDAWERARRCRRPRPTTTNEDNLREALGLRAVRGSR